MKQIDLDREKILLKQSLTPPELADDLWVQVQSRMEGSAHVAKQHTHKAIWLSAASLLCAILLGWWLIQSRGTQILKEPIELQVLVESARIQQLEAVVFEFTDPKNRQTQFFWFEVVPNSQTQSGDES